MSAWLVTVKLPRNPDHNPAAKVTGPCPVNGKPCTDVTGAHHTVLVLAPSAEGAAALFAHRHITRVESV